VRPRTRSSSRASRRKLGSCLDEPFGPVTTRQWPAS
jgi:hypothetical protein